MADFFKFRADHLGALHPPPEARSGDEAMREIVRMQREAGMSSATDGGDERALAEAAARGELVAAVAAKVRALKAQARAPVKAVLPGEARLVSEGADRDAAAEVLREAVAAAFDAGAAYVQVGVEGGDPGALKAKLDLIATAPRSGDTRLAARLTETSLESWSPQLLAVMAAAPVDRILLGFEETPDFARLSEFDPRLDLALAIVPVDVDEAGRDRVLDLVDAAAERVSSDRLALAPRRPLAEAPIDWDRQRVTLWLTADAAIRWWGFEG